MLEKVSVLIVENVNLNENLIESLEENKDFIGEVIFSGSDEGKFQLLKELSIPVEFLNIKTKNKAIKRNSLIEAANYDYLFFLDSGCNLEDSTIEELLEVMEETEADFVYPNIIIKFSDGEKIKNFQDLYGRELELVRGLSAEEVLPEWGILAKKDTFAKLGKFEELFGDFEFYHFIYSNLRNLRLKLSDFSYIESAIYDSFIDTSYRSYVIRSLVLKEFDWRKEIFPFLSWEEKPEIAKSTALTLIGNRLSSYFDYLNAAEFFRNALLTFHNQETLRALIRTYIDMGLFDEAKRLISDEQGVSKKDQEEMKFYLNKVSELVKELEKAVEEGKILEVVTAIQEIVSIYSGAPLYNILGVIKWIQKEWEESYKFFFKAVTMNPINRDYLYNLAEMAKKLNRQEEVEGLINRLVNSE